ncbi:MAG: Bro-N domain-containing protein [Alistipes sp.]|nr:Bro-N domain-containing protein [Alistipes sp.]
MNTADTQLSQAFTFNASNQQVRTITIDSEPYFVAKDVCDILSLSDVSMAVSRLDDDEKLTQALLVSGQKRQMWCVNESGLYHLIFQSRKPEAKAFRKWVTAEVLPTLRRTGRYEVKPRRWSQRYERPKEFLDLRSEPYEQKMLNGYAVRVVTHEDVEWYSVADILRSMQVGTSAFQTAASLNASNRELARKIHIFGNTHPAWFTTITGLRLIMSGSRYLLSNPQK